ncbi:MAG: hypothetical protein EBR08_01155, partial [Bacteroidia bacterium]|nr:hypothetical protein [Bacteroidia bacterium]
MEYIIGLIVIIVIVYLISNTTKKTDNPNILEQKKETLKSQFVLTEEFKEILDILKNTNQSVFITGKAGTGKSSLLKHFIKNTNKKLVILAPTGIAALNVSGQTIHSFFRFPPSIITPNKIEPDY